MFTKQISTFLAAAVLFAGASFTALGCDGAGYKAAKAPESQGAGMSSMAGNETGAGGSSLADGAGNDTSTVLDALIVQSTGTSEQ